MAEHIAHLETVLKDQDRMRLQISRFVRHFARPHGMDVACVPVLARAIEALGEAAPEPHSVSLQTWLLRCGLYPVAVAFRLGRLMAHFKNKREKRERKSRLRDAAVRGTDPLQQMRAKKQERTSGPL
jgi:hypothetical protein